MIRANTSAMLRDTGQVFSAVRSGRSTLKELHARFPQKDADRISGWFSS